METIIGIDPGTRFTGIGVIEKNGSKLRFIHSETIVTTRQERIEEKLEIIDSELTGIIQRFNPQFAAIERIFHSVNPKSSLVLGHARGVALLALRKQRLPINEYAPNEVKLAVVGAGRASKDQVAAMVKILLNIRDKSGMKEDETDALAVAICHANTFRYVG